MTVCPECMPHWEAWLTSPALPSERKLFSLTDKPDDMERINYERWRDRVRSQLSIIESICKEKHQ